MNVLGTFAAVQQLADLSQAGLHSAAQSHADYRDVFGSDAGQRVLADIMAKSGFFSAGVSEESPRSLGRREVVLLILEAIEGERDADGMRINPYLKPEERIAPDVAYEHGPGSEGA